MFKKGIESYLAQCADGGVLIESAAAICDVPVYLFPATVNDSEVYGGAQGDFARLYIATRMSRDNGVRYCLDDKDRKEAMNELSQCSEKDVTAVLLEMMDAYGEGQTAEQVEQEKETLQAKAAAEPDLNLDDEVSAVNRVEPTIEAAEKNFGAAQP